MILWGVPLVIVVSWFGGWLFTGAIAIVSAYTAYETVRLIMPSEWQKDTVLLAALNCGAIPIGLAFYGLISLPVILVAGIILAGTVAVFRPMQYGYKQFMTVLFVTVYIGLPFAAVILLRHDPVWITNFLGAAIIIYLWGGVWVADTFAYLIGRYFGKYPLSKTLSPNKTIEGAVSSVFGGFLWAFLAGIVFKDLLTWYDQLAIGAIIGILSIVGDLAESMIKRVANVKDTGTIFPGHGGMLDRFDSQLFVQPAVYVYLLIAGVLSVPQVPLLQFFN